MVRAYGHDRLIVETTGGDLMVTIRLDAYFEVGDLVEAVRESDHFLGVRAFRVAGCRVNVSK